MIKPVNVAQVKADLDNGIIVSRITIMALIEHALNMENVIEDAEEKHAKEIALARTTTELNTLGALAKEINTIKWMSSYKGDAWDSAIKKVDEEIGRRIKAIKV